MFRNAGLDDRVLEDNRYCLSRYDGPHPNRFQVKSMFLILQNRIQPCVVVSQDYFSLGY